MIVARRSRFDLWEHTFRAGDVVPNDVWEKLPQDKQKILISQRYVEHRTETQAQAAEAPRRRGRPKGSTDTKPRRRRREAA